MKRLIPTRIVIIRSHIPRRSPRETSRDLLRGHVITVGVTIGRYNNKLGGGGQISNWITDNQYKVCTGLNKIRCTFYKPTILPDTWCPLRDPCRPHPLPVSNWPTTSPVGRSMWIPRTGFRVESGEPLLSALFAAAERNQPRLTTRAHSSTILRLHLNGTLPCISF